MMILFTRWQLSEGRGCLLWLVRLGSFVGEYIWVVIFFFDFHVVVVAVIVVLMHVCQSVIPIFRLPVHDGQTR